MLKVTDINLPNNTRRSLELLCGETVVLSGSNGSGKSLFLKGLCLLIPATWASYSFEGTEVSTLNPQEFRRDVLYVPPTPLEVQGPVSAYCQYPWTLKVRLEQAPAGHNFAELKREGLWESEFAQLSSGEKQYVQLLRALAVKPKVLLLDETLGHMDPVRRARSEELLLTHQQEHATAVLLVSHESGAAQRLKARSVVF